MAPTRTEKSYKNGESSASTSSHKSKRKSKTLSVEASSSQPGVQRLKSALRQTRRLLAKENLAADVRVETERRFKALEADLARGEVSKKEKALAVRYHKIKFFERQKVLRKLHQVKKQLANQSNRKSKACQDLESSLHALRVDLNYILHYPKLKKYISLFPPEARQANAAVDVNQVGPDWTSTARDSIRTRMKSLMSENAISGTPEVVEMVSKGAPEVDWEGDSPSKSKKAKEPDDTGVELDDAFFGDEDAESEEFIVHAAAYGSNCEEGHPSI